MELLFDFNLPFQGFTCAVVAVFFIPIFESQNTILIQKLCTKLCACTAVLYPLNSINYM